jgi:hypothetical protein
LRRRVSSGQAEQAKHASLLLPKKERYPRRRSIEKNADGFLSCGCIMPASLTLFPNSAIIDETDASNDLWNQFELRTPTSQKAGALAAKS